MNKTFIKPAILFFFSAFLLSLYFLAFNVGSAASLSNIKIRILPAPQCSDGSDNDGDGLTDYPADLDCVSYADNSEAAYVAPPNGGGGGGGGGFILPPAVTEVTFSGRAYPLSKVSILKDGQIAITTIAGPDSNFQVSLNGLASGNYVFAVYGEDDSNRRSSLFTFPIFITQGAVTNVSGIFIAPTIALDKSMVARGDNLAIFGKAASESDVTISVHSAQELTLKTKADANGVYLYNLDTIDLEAGQHLAKSKATLGNAVSSFGNSLSFQVGDKNKPAEEDGPCSMKADLNCDNHVNLVDFSIAAFWYKRTLSDSFKAKETKLLSGDGKLDLVDFSIMAYHWTG